MSLKLRKTEENIFLLAVTDAGCTAWLCVYKELFENDQLGDIDEEAARILQAVGGDDDEEEEAEDGGDDVEEEDYADNFVVDDDDHAWTPPPSPLPPKSPDKDDTDPPADPLAGEDNPEEDNPEEERKGKDAPFSPNGLVRFVKQKVQEDPAFATGITTSINTKRFVVTPVANNADPNDPEAVAQAAVTSDWGTSYLDLDEDASEPFR